MFVHGTTTLTSGQILTTTAGIDTTPTVPPVDEECHYCPPPTLITPHETCENEVNKQYLNIGTGLSVIQNSAIQLVALMVNLKLYYFTRIKHGYKQATR